MVALLAVLPAVGCGSNSTTAVHAATSPSTSAPSPAAPRDCNALGINPSGMREGTCTHSGTTYVIVDENHALRLRTLTAKLDSTRVAASLPGAVHSATPGGAFVIATLTITNRLALPQVFDQSGTQQAGLILDAGVFKEARSAEGGPDPSSCLNRKRSPIQPGKSETCEVVFDVPATSAASLGKHGTGDLYVVDFGQDLAGGTPPMTVGQIRLYH
jgi:hypothetical protein